MARNAELQGSKPVAEHKRLLHDASRKRDKSDATKKIAHLPNFQHLRKEPRLSFSNRQAHLVLVPILLVECEFQRNDHCLYMGTQEFYL
jgi:hypothetical protein